MRFQVRSLLNGEGWVIVDTRWVYPMIGPYRKLANATKRAAEFEADERKVPR